MGYLYLFLILFVLFQFVFPMLLPLFHVQNCLSAFWFFSTFYFPFVDSLVLLFCCQSQNECETSVSCEFTLFCTFFFYVFVCYKLSWFINPSRLLKGKIIDKPKIYHWGSKSRELQVMDFSRKFISWEMRREKYHDRGIDWHENFKVHSLGTSIFFLLSQTSSFRCYPL